MNQLISYEKLDIKVKKSWRIGRSIFLGVIATIILAVYIFLYISEISEEARFWVGIGGIGVGILGVLYIGIFPEIQYKRWGYYIGEDKVEIKKGIVFITIETIPIIRIQHITSSRGPIDRKFNLATVEMSTASGKFEIVGLREELGIEISERLKSKLIKRLEEEKW